MDSVAPAIVEVAVEKAYHLVSHDSIPVKENLKKKLQRFLKGWRVTICAASVIAWFVLIVNIALLIWASTKENDFDEDDLSILYQGSCSRMSIIYTAAHLAINVFSTLLLAASNVSCQILSAPTREELDIAHARGTWLDIGVTSVKNLRHISIKRVAMIFFLSLSSVPLHLLYNSVIFPTTSTYDTLAIVAGSSFVKGIPPNRTEVFQKADHPRPPFKSALFNYSYQAIIRLQSEASALEQGRPNKLTSFNKVECLKELELPVVSNQSHFLIISEDRSIADVPDGLVHWYPKAFNPKGFRPWICTHADYGYGCHNSSSNGTYNYYVGTEKKTHPSHYYANEPKAGVPISFCLAENASPMCSININKSILGIVISCNFIKLVCFILVLLWPSQQEPMVTLGDCIASFLAKADASSQNLGPLSVVNVRELASFMQNHASEPSRKPWTAKRHFWFRPVGWKRWLLLFISYVIILIMAFVVIFSLSNGGIISFHANVAGTALFGRWYAIRSAMQWSLTKIVLVVNSPQLATSIFYLCSNTLLTICFQAAEFCGFAERPKAIRVATNKRGFRPTHWLQIPYYYAIPNLLIWAVFHWIWSETFFPVRFNTFRYNPDGHVTPVQSDSISTIGISSMLNFVAFGLGTIIFFVLLGLSFRRYPANIPVVGTCSLAIAAACHSPEAQEEDLTQLPLHYGVLRQETQGEDESDAVRQVGLSARKVDPLVKGEVYR